MHYISVHRIYVQEWPRSRPPSCLNSCTQSVTLKRFYRENTLWPDALKFGTRAAHINTFVNVCAPLHRVDLILRINRAAIQWPPKRCRVFLKRVPMLRVVRCRPKWRGYIYYTPHVSPTTASAFVLYYSDFWLEASCDPQILMIRQLRFAFNSIDTLCVYEREMLLENYLYRFAALWRTAFFRLASTIPTMIYCVFFLSLVGDFPFFTILRLVFDLVEI